MFINQRALQKKLTNNALEISSQAKKQKREDLEVINASIGMMMDDDFSFFEFKTVTDVIQNLSVEEKYSYSNTSATKEFEEKIYTHLFKEYLSTIQTHFYLGTCPTPGGTGALSLAFSNYLDVNETILFSDVCWGNYFTMCEQYQIPYETHSYINADNQFDRQSFLEKIHQILQNQDKLIYLLNDPCHNPTGFNLKREDYLFIIDTFNELNQKNKNCILILDIAYLDFANENFFTTREFFSLFQKLDKNTLLLVCFSGSKTFSLYGLRLGALSILSKTAEERDLFLNCSEFSSRTMWSNIASIGIQVVEKVLGNPKFDIELQTVRSIMKRRSDLFRELIQKTPISIYPYSDGFFVTIKTNQPTLLFEKLKTKKVYGLPLKKGLRISLSSVSLKEIPALIERISDVYE